MIRVLVVDAGRLSREVLARTLNDQQELEVVGTTGHVASAEAMVADLEPHVILLNMNTHDCMRLVDAIGGLHGDVRLVALGECPATAVSELHDPSFAEVVAAIHAAGHSVVVRSSKEGASRRMSEGLLTPRECEIVRLIDDGLSNKEIARELNMAVSTVKNHVHNVLEKLRVQRRGQAAALMRSAGVHGRSAPYRAARRMPAGS